MAGSLRPVSHAQVRKLMEEMSKHGSIGLGSMKARMERVGRMNALKRPTVISYTPSRKGLTVAEYALLM